MNFCQFLNVYLPHFDYSMLFSFFGLIEKCLIFLLYKFDPELKLISTKIYRLLTGNFSDMIKEGADLSIKRFDKF